MIKKASLFLLLATSGCFWLNETSELAAARRQSQYGNHAEAVLGYEKIQKKYPGKEETLTAAQEGARISFMETKDYPKAITFYRYLVLYSPDEKERIFSQMRLAEIYFERLNDYPKAVVELNKLLMLPHSVGEEVKFRMNLAKAYFYQNIFSQAETESSIILQRTADSEIRFEALLMKANINFTTKRIDDAIRAYKELLLEYPVQAKEEQVGLSLAVCYEEKNEFALARAILSSLKESYPQPEFLDLKIKRLQERETQLPGAGGLKK